MGYGCWQPTGMYSSEALAPTNLRFSSPRPRPPTKKRPRRAVTFYVWRRGWGYGCWQPTAMYSSRSHALTNLRFSSHRPCPPTKNDPAGSLCLYVWRRGWDTAACSRLRCNPPEALAPTNLRFSSPRPRPPTKKRPRGVVMFICMAERVGFEPTEACTSAVFKTAALNHSTTSPIGDKKHCITDQKRLSSVIFC